MRLSSYAHNEMYVPGTKTELVKRLAEITGKSQVYWKKVPSKKQLQRIYCDKCRNA